MVPDRGHSKEGLGVWTPRGLERAKGMESRSDAEGGRVTERAATMVPGLQGGAGSHPSSLPTLPRPGVCLTQPSASSASGTSGQPQQGLHVTTTTAHGQGRQRHQLEPPGALPAQQPAGMEPLKVWDLPAVQGTTASQPLRAGRAPEATGFATGFLLRWLICGASAGCHQNWGSHQNWDTDEKQSGRLGLLWVLCNGELTGGS